MTSLNRRVVGNRFVSPPFSPLLCLNFLPCYRRSFIPASRSTWRERERERKTQGNQSIPTLETQPHYGNAFSTAKINPSNSIFLLRLSVELCRNDFVAFQLSCRNGQYLTTIRYARNRMRPAHLTQGKLSLAERRYSVYRSI